MASAWLPFVQRCLAAPWVARDHGYDWPWSCQNTSIACWGRSSLTHGMAKGAPQLWRACLWL